MAEQQCDEDVEVDSKPLVVGAPRSTEVPPVSSRQRTARDPRTGCLKLCAGVAGSAALVLCGRGVPGTFIDDDDLTLLSLLKGKGIPISFYLARQLYDV